MSTPNRVKLAGAVLLFLSATMHAEGIHVKNLNKSGAEQQTIVNTFDFIKENADAKCLAWMPAMKESIVILEGDAKNPDTVLLAHGDVQPSSIVAFTGATPDN